MVAPQNSTNVRSVDPEELAALAELFFRPRTRLRLEPSLSEVGWSELRLQLGALALRGHTVGAGPKVLLVHGWEGAAGQLRVLGEFAASRRRQVVAFDLPAHGLSEGEKASVPIFAAALRELARELGPFEGVIAHSLGGAATMLAAGDLGARWFALLAPAAEPVHFIRGFGAAAGLPEEAMPAMIAAVERCAGARVEELHAPTHAARLDAEVVVLHDPGDREVPFAHGSQIAHAARRGKLVELAGAGHRRILSDPRALAELAALLGPA